MTEDILLSHRDGAVLELTLNRPAVMNAISHALKADLVAAFQAASQDKTLRAIILTGAGRAFSAGVDLKELAEQDGAMAQMRRLSTDSLFDVIRACPVPMIAAVNGAAVTGGLELAMMSDFILAGQSARFADTHARVGIVPGWGMSQVLPALVGVNRARQLSLTGEFIDGQTACAWGLATEVLPDDQLMPRARALAAQIAETDRTTMIRLRSMINLSQDLGLTEGMAQEVAQYDDHIRTVSAETVGANRKTVTQRGRAIAAGQKESK